MFDLPTLHRLSQCRIPALIALCAILMLFIAPEISRILEHRRAQAGVAHSSVTMAGMDMGMMPMAHEQRISAEHHASRAARSGEHVMESASQHEPHSSKASTGRKPMAAMMFGSLAMMDDFACGYCQLLAHFPVMLWIVLAAILLLFVTSRALPYRFIPASPATFFPGVSQPRAPPAL